MSNLRKFLLALLVFFVGYAVTRATCGTPRTEPPPPQTDASRPRAG